MLNLRKNTLALAVAAAATLGGGISAVQAQTVAADGLGQALIYPYFTVRDGWRTFIHVTNTSDRTVAAKVRILSARESFDLLDFVVVLSPYDMWTAVMEERGGRPGIRATDNTCTVPRIGSGNFIPLRTIRFPANPPVQLDWLREGHVEIIQMGVSEVETTSIAVAAKHGASGVPNNCATVEAGFSAANIEATRDQFEPANGNVLAGKFDLINTGRAYAGASRAVPIADLSTQNLMYGQFSPQWDYPRLANTKVGAPDILTEEETEEGIEPVNAALAAISISNEWVLNPGINELSSWVVTFPTKYMTPAGTAPFTGLPSGSACPTGFTAKSVPIDIALFNREEQTTFDVDFSPGAGPSEFCFETNVVNFTSGSISSAGLLNSVVAKSIDVDGLGSPFLGGWARLNHSLAPTIAAMPAVGFNLTARSNADGDSAVMYDHVYEGRGGINRQ